MEITVGLDFGTHQTKVCISRATNPGNVTHEFLEFEKPTNVGHPAERTVLFPSIVQVNQDDSLSFGFIDESKAKIKLNGSLVEPRLLLNDEPISKSGPKPVLNKPSQPQIVKKAPSKQDWKDELKKLKDKTNSYEIVDPKIQKWKDDCDRIERNYKKELDLWNRNESEYLIAYSAWEKECEIRKKFHDKEHKEWQNDRNEKMTYRYFKLASFSNSISWRHQIGPDKISIWYLAYVIFTITEHLKGNTDFHIQIGVPSHLDINYFNLQKRKAEIILVSAMKLKDKYGSLEEFMNAKSRDLLQDTNAILAENPSQKEVVDLGLHVQPEAYAALSSITQKRALEHGMSLLVDIGGGTTDIAFFTIRQDQPDIHAVISFPIGLNSIYDKYRDNHPEIEISRIPKLFNKSMINKDLDIYMYEYIVSLKNEVKKMIDNIIISFKARSSEHKLPLSSLWKALGNRPVVFCGGGSMFNALKIPLHSFNETKIIDRNYLNISALINRDIDLTFPLLATSYGLSIPQIGEINITRIEDVFAHLNVQNNGYTGGDYLHGLTST